MKRHTFEGVEWIFIPQTPGVDITFAEDESLDPDEIVIQLGGRSGLFSLKPDDEGKGIRVHLNFEDEFSSILNSLGDVRLLHADTRRVQVVIELDMFCTSILVRYPPGKKPQIPPEQ